MLYVPFSKILSILYVSKAMVDYLIKQNQIFDIIIIMDDIDMTASIRPRPFSRGNKISLGITARVLQLLQFGHDLSVVETPEIIGR